MRKHTNKGSSPDMVINDVFCQLFNENLGKNNKYRRQTDNKSKCACSN